MSFSHEYFLFSNKTTDRGLMLHKEDKDLKCLGHLNSEHLSHLKTYYPWKLMVPVLLRIYFWLNPVYGKSHSNQWILQIVYTHFALFGDINC